MRLLVRILPHISFVFLISILIHGDAYAQLRGRITDEKGQNLPFASVFVKSSTKGSSANSEGVYTLHLDKGTYEVGFHFVGYQTYYAKVNIEQEPYILNVVLKEETYSLPELEIRSDAEDPAYAIIRKTIENRTRYKASVKSFSSENYIKSIIRLKDAPEILMGQKIGNLEGILDEDRKGILYLSESQNLFFFQAPDKRKEVMVSSKVSGSDNGFSFNRFGWLDFYDKELSLGRTIVNPIGDQALRFYKYKLHAAFYDENGTQINKIEVIPKNKMDPVMAGFIYIVDQKWLVQSVDFYLTKDNTKIDLADTIRIQQVYLPIGNQFMPLFQQNIIILGKILGFTFEGHLMAVSSNYEMNRSFEEGFFNREIVRIEPLSNKKTDEYWNEIRPVPLTLEERKDYVKKDSLQELRNSKSYLDSLDELANEFKTINLFTGYTHRNTYKKRNWSLGPHTHWYNPVQGWTLGLKGKFEQEYVKGKMDNITYYASTHYGFSDQQIRSKLGVSLSLKGLRRTIWTAEAGNEVLDVNDVNPLSDFFNAYLIAVANKSIKRFYHSEYALIRWKTGYGNGHTFFAEVKGENRYALENSSTYMFSPSDRSFPRNDDFGPFNTSPPIQNNRLLRIHMYTDIRPGQEYISYPDQRFYVPSDWPNIRIGHKSGLVISDEGNAFHMSYFAIFKKEIWSTIAGHLSLYAEAGAFWNKPASFLDYHHFRGAESIWITEENYLRGFQLLPVYGYSTDSRYGQVHLEWNDKGFVFDQIPGVKRLGFSLAVGTSWLSTPLLRNYQEFFVGIDRIGFKAFRLLRINGVMNLQNGKYNDIGATISFRINL